MIALKNPTELLYEYGYFPECAYDSGSYYRAIRYRSGIWATSKRGALAKLRKLNLKQSYLMDSEPKKRRGYKLSSDLMVESFKNRHRKMDHMDAIHSLTFETYLALNSGVMSLDRAVGDMGLLHEFTHAIFSKEWSRTFGLEKPLVKACLKMELLIPGLLNKSEILSHRKKIDKLAVEIHAANSYKSV